MKIKKEIIKELRHLSKPYLQSWKGSKDLTVNVKIQMNENKYDPLTNLTYPSTVKGTSLELIINNEYTISGQLKNGFTGTGADAINEREEVEAEIDKTIETILTDILDNNTITQGFEVKQRD